MRKCPHIKRRKLHHVAIKREISLEDFIDARALSQHVGHQRDRDARSPVDGSPKQYLRIGDYQLLRLIVEKNNCLVRDTHHNSRPL